MVGLPLRWKNFEDMYNRLDTIPACDRRTDKQTSFYGIVRAMHTRCAVKTTSLLDSAMNLQQYIYYVFHRTLNTSLHYLAKLLLRTRSTFSEMVFMSVSTFAKTNLMFVDPGVKMNYWHTLLWRAAVCHVRSLASSLSSCRTVLLHTELATQSAFWTGKPLSISQTCGSEQSRSERGWVIFEYRIWGEMLLRCY